MSYMHTNKEVEQSILKTQVISEAIMTTTPFKVAFKATLGFYFAQFVATLIGLIVFIIALGGIAILFK